MQALAERITEALRAEVGESLHVVSYYDGEELGHVYRSDVVRERYEESQVEEIVADLELESIAQGAHEARHREELHATVRIYDDFLDFTVPLGDLRGVAVALDVDGDYRVREVVDSIEAAADE